MDAGRQTLLYPRQASRAGRTKVHTQGSQGQIPVRRQTPAIIHGMVTMVTRLFSMVTMVTGLLSESGLNLLNLANCKMRYM